MYINFSLYFLTVDTRALSLDLGGTAGCLFRFLSQLLVVIRLTQLRFISLRLQSIFHVFCGTRENINSRENLTNEK